MKSSQWYEIRNATGTSADIYIYEQIGENWWTGEGVTAKAFVKDLKALGNADINLHINSGGGSVFDASAIYTALKAHKGNVTSYIDGIAASAASWIALAANQVVMADNALFMIHNPFGGAQGNAQDMRDMADILDKIRDTMVTIYMTKTNLTESQLLAALDAETWYSASEAKDAGFVDVITDEQLAAANFNREPLRNLGYRNIPAQLTNQESEAVMTTAPEETATEPVVEVPVVEASRPVVTAGYTVGELRSPIKTHANYMQHMIAARMGNDESADYVRAADAYGRKIENANESFTTNPAFSPVRYAPGVIDATVYKDRPTIDALGGTLPITDTGMTISHPKITTAGTAGIIAEGASTASTQLVSSYVDATVVKIASEQIMSVELLERSGPAFYDAMFNNISKAYNRAANAAVIAEIVSGGTQASTQAATIAGLQAYIAQAGPAVYAGSKELPTALIAGVSVWSLLIGSLDSTGRPLFTALNPQNATGTSSPRSLKGDVMGLDLWVDSGMVATTIDDCAFIGNKESIAMYESPKLTMTTNVTGTGEIKVLLYGYFAVKTLIATGLQRFNLT